MEATNSQKDSGWNISELYSRAWQIIKKNKVLWLFGMASAALGSNFSSHSNFNSSSKGSSSLQNLPTVFTQHIYPILASVPTQRYIVLGIGFLLLALFGIILNFIYKAWSEASLLTGIQHSIGGKTVSIQSSSESSFGFIKPLIWLNIVPCLVLFVATVAVIAVLAALLTITPGATKALPLILLIAASITAIVGFIIVTLAQIWAPRLVVLEGRAAKESFFAALEIAKGKFWPMIGLGIVNTILSGIIVLIPLAFIGAVGVGGFLALGSNKSLGMGLLVSAGVVLALFFLSYLIIAGTLNAFKATVWTLAYFKIKERFRG